MAHALRGLLDVLRCCLLAAVVVVLHDFSGDPLMTHIMLVDIPFTCGRYSDNFVQQLPSRDITPERQRVNKVINLNNYLLLESFLSNGQRAESQAVKAIEAAIGGS